MDERGEALRASDDACGVSILEVSSGTGECGGEEIGRRTDEARCWERGLGGRLPLRVRAV